MTATPAGKLGLTRQREVVLEVIRESPEHPTANDVFDAARAKLPGISFATVYNSLKFLKTAGHIAEIQFGNAASRYDGVMHKHDHAICIECGRLVDIDIEHPKKLVEQASAQSGFRAESLELTLRGVCPDCS